MIRRINLANVKNRLLNRLAFVLTAPSSVHFFVLAHQLAHRSKIRQMALYSFSDVGHFFIKTIKQRAFDETFFHYPWGVDFYGIQQGIVVIQK